MNIDNNIQGHNYSRTCGSKEQFSLPENDSDLSDICKCDICNIYFANVTILSKHKLSKHGTGKFQCDSCNKKLSLRSLKSHKLIHKAAKLYQCDVCNKTFINRYLLARHKLTHIIVFGV